MHGVAFAPDGAGFMSGNEHDRTLEYSTGNEASSYRQSKAQ